jgi:hypothetical protein
LRGAGLGAILGPTLADPTAPQEVADIDEGWDDADLPPVPSPT